MEQEADARRNEESAAILQQGEFAVQQTNALLLHTPGKRINIYLSSVPPGDGTPAKDKKILDELKGQLRGFTDQPHIGFQDKQGILPGAKRAKEILNYVSQAHIILFPVSPEFFASDECSKEIELAMKRMETDKTHIIPILIRHTQGWRETPRHIKRLKVQTCLCRSHVLEKALSPQGLSHDISHNGRFLRLFLVISAAISYNGSLAESTSVLVVFSGGRYAR
jgi:hypothetical protein